MRLSRLTLHGFKTFADRTEVEVGPGLTAIVGPNGSGKSNLVDAIRWVLGEATARELRGTRAEQVIFAGGAGRAPMGMAEVILTLEGPEGWLAVEGAELAVARRVYRDGVSEFRQSGRRVRLRDLEHLLQTTGLTQSGYAIIGQDDIEQVVQGSPTQRRQLIEVAAGVRFHQEVLQEAQAALAATGVAMEGAGGRLAEIEPRMADLEREAAASAEAERLQGRLRQLRGSLEREAWLRATGEVQRLRRRQGAAAARLADAEAAVRDFAPAYRAGVAAVERVQAARPAAERRLGEARVELERARAQAERWEERCLELAAAHGRALRAAAVAAGDRRAALALADPSTDRTALEGLEAGRAQLEAARAAAAELAGRAIQVEQRRREATDRLGAATARADRARSVAEVARSALATLATACDARRQSAREARARAEQLAAAIPAALGLQEQAAAAQAEAARELSRAEAAEAAALAALEVSEAERRRRVAAQAAAEGDRAARAALLAAQDHGPLARAARAGELDLVPLLERVRPRLAADTAAVEGALAEVSGALVGDRAVAVRAAACAGGGAELLLWDTGDPAPQAPDPPPGCRPLSAALHPDPGIDGIVARLAGGVALVRDPAAAEAWLARQPAGRAVLPDGTVLGRGLRRTPAGQPGRIEHAGQLAAAETRVAAAERAVAEAAAGAERARAAHVGARAAVDAAREARAASGVAAESASHGLERARRSLQAAEREADAADAARRRGQSELERAQASTQAEARSAAEAAAEMDRARADLAGVDALAAELAASLSAARERAQAAAVAVARAEGAVSLAEERAAERRRRLAAADLAEAEALRSAADGEREATAGLAALQTAREAVRGAAADAATAEAARRGVVEAGGDPLAELSELEGRRAALASAVARAEADVAEAAAEHDQRAREADRLAPPADAGGVEAGVDPDRAAREIQRLERRLELLGPVNALAARQLEELLARTAGLRAAHADCAAALGECAEIAAVLRARVEARFNGTVAVVAERFGDYIKELFDGGRGGLERVLPPPRGEGEAMSSPIAPAPGIQLTVAPRGKRPTPLALLSGGERSLTALAFILALQAVRPSPFYVFDEVDAALDDHRVGRFVDLVQRLAAETQFLVVTHNHATMERAGVLLGITLAGDGTSRVLSVELETARASAEPEPAGAGAARGDGARGRRGA